MLSFEIMKLEELAKLTDEDLWRIGIKQRLKRVHLMSKVKKKVEKQMSRKSKPVAQTQGSCSQTTQYTTPTASPEAGQTASAPPEYDKALRM